MNSSLSALVAALSLLLACAALAYASGKARIAVVGDVDMVRVGLDGYCGRQQEIRKEDRMGIFVPGERQVWIRTVSRRLMVDTSMQRCEGNFSFTPRSDTAYIARLSLLRTSCLIELFRVVPGKDPIPEPVELIEGHPCVLGGD